MCCSLDTAVAWSISVNCAHLLLLHLLPWAIFVFLQAGWDDNQMKYLLRELLIHQELSACR
jgi:hypothetical protein